MGLEDGKIACARELPFLALCLLLHAPLPLAASLVSTAVVLFPSALVQCLLRMGISYMFS